MSEERGRRSVDKVANLLKEQRASVIEELGPTAFEALTPQEAANLLEIKTVRIPDLIREGWLEPIPGKDIGRGHQYYRWRVVFVQRYRKTRAKHASSPT